ncbi:DUF5317 domain-containing protein [Brevibacillus dissolubilis]|uniref:DUF5317 domain-containing protein n=1 Tax=Brevibacillus dissolubilis TaxID=1844116 RepID=UPI002100529D|nr:DUF5317 domain-containing protein [Brevibacillus dissolubilis]
MFLGSSIVLQLCSAFLPGWSGVLVSLAYVGTLLFFMFNREHEDIRIFMVGWFMNALAIWLNGGKMPIDLEQAKKLPYSLDAVINGTDFKHSVLTEVTRVPFFADIIYMPYPIPRVISLGDVFIMIGAFLLIQRIMNKPISLVHLREGKNYATKN